MLQTAGRRLRPVVAEQLRCFVTAASQQASPALTEASPPPGSGGFLASLFGASRSGVDMTIPLPGVATPAEGPIASTRPGTELTTLPNGIKIATEATPGPTATMGFFIDSGSVYESPEQAGLSHLLEYMAFKSTVHRTHFRLVREVEAIGANVTASASREQMAYNIDFVKTNLPEALEILTDSVINPKFNPWEVEEQIQKMKADIKIIKDNPQTALLEGLHEVAFTGALAKPLIAPESVISGLSAEKLAAFVAENYTAPRIVLAGSGLDHQAVVSLATPLLGDLAAAPKIPTPPSSYIGGDFRQYSASGVTQLMIAFNSPGGWKDVKGSVAMTVLQFLLGGGGSFSAGGPGKGMHSRLYQRVLNQYTWMHQCTAICSLYNDTGLFGIFASPESSKVAEAVQVVANELLAVAKDVPTAELERAKNAAISSVLMNLESRAVVAEDIGRQVVTYGHRKSTAEFVAAMRALTPADITAVVSKALKTPVSVAVLGDISSMPRYDAIAKKFG